MPTVIGGKLKLKGDKSKKKTKKREREEVKEEVKEEAKTQENGGKEDEDEVLGQHYTEAQRKHIKKLREAEEREFRKNALKSYRQRVEELNAHLSQLTEHNDIPRVSAAGNG